MNAIANSPGLTIQDLPYELLYEILKRVQIKNDSDIDILQQVCCRWYSLIDQWIGRTVSTRTERVVHPGNPELRKRGLELISEIGVSFLHVKCRDGADLLEQPPSPLPSFKFPYLLKHLRLHGTIHPDLFLNLVKDINNLSVLDISFPILSHLRDSDLKQLHFPRLVKLRVTYEYGASESLSSLPNLHTLLKENSFPWLTRLRIEFPVETSKGFETIKALVSFLCSHPQIEKLSVSVVYSGYRPQQPLNNSHQDLQLDAILNEVRRSRICSLTNIQVAGMENIGNPSYFDICTEIVVKQNSLRSLELYIDSGLNKMVKAICSPIGSTLVNLQIGLVEGIQEWIQLDCASFSPLKVIRCLTIHGFGLGIIGTQHLPLSLRSIYFEGFMSSEEVTHILLTLPNLKCISLQQLENEEGEYGDGVNVDVLQQFIQNRKVKQLNLSRIPISDEFPLEGISNDDPINPQRVTVQLRWVDWGLSTRYIRWKFNKDGYYVNITDDDDDE